MLDRLEQFRKAAFPIKVTLLDIVMLDRLEQYPKARVSIEVTGRPL